MTLKFGYKASAEQFGPRDLVEFSVLACRASRFLAGPLSQS